MPHETKRGNWVGNSVPALADSYGCIQRLMNIFGTPNAVNSLDVRTGFASCLFVRGRPGYLIGQHRLNNSLRCLQPGRKRLYPSGFLPCCDRVDARRLGVTVRRAKWSRSRGVAKSTKARTFGTDSLPCGETSCTGNGGYSWSASTICNFPSRTCSAA